MEKDNKVNKIIGSIQSQLQIRELIPEAKTISRKELEEIISSQIKNLIENDFEKFLSLMYRLDVSESILKTLMAKFNGSELYLNIAKSIIQREEEKIESRKKYSS